MIFRFHRNVIYRIICWISILICINSKNREITCMSWPFPVVVISTKLSNQIWRRTYQTNILEILVNEIIIFIVFKKLTNLNGIFSTFIVFLFDFSNFLIDYFFSFILRHFIVDQTQNSFRNIVHSYKKSNG